MFFLKRKPSKACLIVVAILVAVAVFVMMQTTNSAIRAFGASPIDAGDDELFIVASYEGKVAVFVKGETKPCMIYETLVETLPEMDRELLAEGIEVRGDELRELVEDLTS